MTIITTKTQSLVSPLPQLPHGKNVNNLAHATDTCTASDRLPLNGARGQAAAESGREMPTSQWTGMNFLNSRALGVGRITDVDGAKISSELARTQISAEAATAVLAQANLSQQWALELLQG